MIGERFIEFDKLIDRLIADERFADKQYEVRIVLIDELKTIHNQEVFTFNFFYQIYVPKFLRI